MNPITLQNGNVCGHNCQNIDTWIAKAFLTAFWLTERDKEWELCRNPGKCSSARVTWLRAKERLQRCVGDPVLCLSFCRSSLYVPIKWPLLRVLVARSECFLLGPCLHWAVLFADTSYTSHLYSTLHTIRHSHWHFATHSLPQPMLLPGDCSRHSVNRQRHDTFHSIRFSFNIIIEYSFRGLERVTSILH